MKRKITEISVFEFFCCIFVISIHVLSEGVDFFPKLSAPSIIFYSITRLMTFAVPGFVFTSAIKMFYKYGEGNFNYPKFLAGRFLKVYLPYVLWVVIYYVVFVYGLELDGFKSFNTKELLGFIASGNISAQFYFVILIVQLYLLMPLWILLSRIKSKGFAISLLAVSFIVTILSRMYFPQCAEAVLTFIKNSGITGADKINVPTQIALSAYTNRAFTSYLVFWVAGMYIGIDYERFSNSLIASRPVVYTGWLLLALTHCILSYIKYCNLITYSFEPIIVVLFCLFSIFGFAIYTTNLTFSLEKMGKGFLASIADASYDIYLIHCLVITVASYYLGHIEIESIMQRFLITAVITYTFSIVFCVLKSTIQTNIKMSYKRRSAEKSRKMARRKRYL